MLRARGWNWLNIASVTLSAILSLSLLIVIFSLANMPESCEVYCAAFPVIEGPALLLIPVSAICVFILGVISLALHGANQISPWVSFLLPPVVAVLAILAFN